MFNKIAALLALFVSSIAANAQGGKQMFNDTILHRIDVKIDPYNWFDILEEDYKNNIKDPIAFPEIYRQCDVTIDGMLLLKCGIREKGNSSNNMHNSSVKKPFKIAFDEFVNQKYDDLKKINLNNFTNDPSLLHEAIAYKLMRKIVGVASRIAFAKLYFNGVYWGLYQITENVDKTFLKYHFGDTNNNGNLYKTNKESQVYLNWLGADKTKYKDAGLELKTNETAADWSKLIHFVDLLNHASVKDIEGVLDSFFDIHNYLKILAVEKCLRSWDSYWGGGNNFYLYEHPDGKIHWIPWDMNESFQDIYILSGTKLNDGYLIPTKTMDERPLMKRIFEVPKFKQEYLDNVCKLIHEDFTLNFIGPFAAMCHTLVDKAYKEDPNKFNSYEAFDKSLVTTHKDEMIINKSSYQITLRYPGIFPFIQSQQKWAVDQLKGWEQTCVLDKRKFYKIEYFPNPTTTEIYVKQFGTDFDYSQFKIYGMNGMLVQNNGYEVFKGAKTKVDLTPISKGVYTIVKIGIDGNLGYSRLVVQ